MTTWPVLTETTHLLAARGQSELSLRFLERCFAGAVDIVDLEARARPRVLELMRRHASLPMDLADASQENEGPSRVF